MKRKLSVIVLTAALNTALILNGCGAGSDKSSQNSSMDSGYDTSMNHAADDSAYEMSAEQESGSSQSNKAEMKEIAAEDMDIADMDAGEGADSASLNGIVENNPKNQTQKLIYTYNYSVETKEFDAFYEKISKKTSQIGGYVESSETNGSVSDGINRYASLTLRIPADKMEQIISLLNSGSNITYQSRSSENVTLRYIDMESHLKALRTEQETLLQLMEKADKLKDVIALQSQLTQIRYEIESYESQLRSYDNLVDYSTLHLEISEVERTTNVASTKTSFFEEAGNRLSDTVYGMGQWLRSAAIWLISSIPVLIPVAAIIAGVMVFMKKKKKQKQSQDENQETNS